MRTLRSSISSWCALDLEGAVAVTIDIGSGEGTEGKGNRFRGLNGILGLTTGITSCAMSPRSPFT